MTATLGIPRNTSQTVQLVQRGELAQGAHFLLGTVGKVTGSAGLWLGLDRLAVYTNAKNIINPAYVTQAYDLAIQLANKLSYTEPTFWQQFMKPDHAPSFMQSARINLAQYIPSMPVNFQLALGAALFFSGKAISAIGEAI